MTKLIKRSRDSGRNFQIQGRLSDKSGHAPILDMLEELEAKGWSKQALSLTAFTYMLEAYNQEKGLMTPIQPERNVSILEILTVVRSAQKIYEDLRIMLKNGNFASSVDGRRIEGAISDLDVKMETLATVSNAFGGELIEIDREEDEDW
jgi:hypothetical protein